LWGKQCTLPHSAPKRNPSEVTSIQLLST
jgi:hypothetical protein